MTEQPRESSAGRGSVCGVDPEPQGHLVTRNDPARPQPQDLCVLACQELPEPLDSVAVDLLLDHVEHDVLRRGAASKLEVSRKAYRMSERVTTIWAPRPQHGTRDGWSSKDVQPCDPPVVVSQARQQSDAALLGRIDNSAPPGQPGRSEADYPVTHIHQAGLEDVVARPALELPARCEILGEVASEQRERDCTALEGPGERDLTGTRRRLDRSGP